MIDSTIITGVLALVGTLAGTFGGILASTKLTNYRIEKLELQVEKHNNLIERVYRLEDNDRLLDERIKSVDHRVDSLEGKLK